MKTITLAILVLFFSLKAMASGFQCADELVTDDYSLPESIENLEKGDDDIFSPERIKIWNDFFGLTGGDYEISDYCIEEMGIDKYIGPSGTVYLEFTTNKDACDGGNVSGLVLNTQNQVVAEIFDGDYICPQTY